MGLVTPLINALAGPLSSILEAISILLEPIADLIGYIIEGIKWLVETGLTLLGKGWLWGTEQGTTATNTMEVPNTSELLNTTSNSNVDNSLTTNNIEINIASNEYTSAEEVSDLVLQKINLKLGEAYRWENLNYTENLQAII